MLLGQCKVWAGVISAAVFVALVDGKAVVPLIDGAQDPQLVEKEAVLDQVRQFHAEAEGSGVLHGTDIRLLFMAHVR